MPAWAPGAISGAALKSCVQYTITCTMSMSRVLVVGCGGVGAIAAYTLQANGADVTAVVRSDYDIVARRGFRIELVDHGLVVYKPKAVKLVSHAAGDYDYVVVTTKNTPDVWRVEDLIAPVVGAKTAIVLVQNGIGIGEPLIAKFPDNVVLSGVSMISSTCYNGDIEHVGPDGLSVGYFPNGRLAPETQERCARDFVALYGKSCSYDADVNHTRWRKLVYNATLNSVCTLTGVDVGRLELFGGNALVKRAMQEVLAVARSDGAVLDELVMDFMLRSDDGVYYAPLMLVDRRKGNYMEVEVVCGNPVRIAQKNGVAAPVLTMAYELLKVVQLATKEEKGAVSVPAQRQRPAARLPVTRLLGDSPAG